MTAPVSAVVECPCCTRMVTTVRRRFARHSTYATGPECIMSGELITDAMLADSVNVARARTVLHWADVLRDEDPALVHAWIARTNRAELEALMCIALAGLNPDQPISKTFEWVKALGA